MNRTIKILKLFYYIIMLIIGFLVGSCLMVILPKYRNAWLISERGNDARDNGYVLFKYVRNNHPEINAFYLINKSSADFNKVNEIGPIIIPGSLVHYALIAVAAVKISTHDMGYTPDMVIYHWINKLKLVPGKKVLLQHGVMNDDIEWYYRSQCNVDLFITSAKEEYNYIVRHYGQPKKVVKLLGLCRYDELENCKVKKQILLMPTWRKYLVNVSRSEFMKSEYYKAFQDLLTSKALLQLLEEEDYTMVFYPHIEMQQYIHTFKTTSKRVRVASFETDNIQNLIKESQILITDYSSVFFDMIYMKRNIVFYHFDREQFENDHYKKGWVEYSRFGNVAYSKQDVIRYMEESIKGNIKNKDPMFFEYYDGQNCKRTFNEISKLIKN